MLKVGGIYVSPFEVEGALHEPSRRCWKRRSSAWPDEEELIKPKAFVVLKSAGQGQRGARAGAAGPLQGSSSRPTSIRAGSSSAPSCRRPRPARSSASSCGRSARRLRCAIASLDCVGRFVTISPTGQRVFSRHDAAQGREAMRKIFFGRTGLEISALAFGGGVTGGILINADEATCYNALRCAVTAGVNWIDTAPVYGNGASEAAIGRHLQFARAAALRIRPRCGIEADDMGDIAGAIERSLTQSLERLRSRSGRALSAAQSSRPWGRRADRAVARAGARPRRRRRHLRTAQAAGAIPRLRHHRGRRHPGVP